jgi:ribose 5-phosphate isomerase A
MSAAEQKRRAAEASVTRVRPGQVVGLGTGSTAALAVEAIARRLEAGTLHDVIGIPTSTQTCELARSLGVPLGTLDDHPTVDVTIDGADEVDPDGNLTKGGGGALLWEKIVAAASQRYIIVVDESKLVRRLGVLCAIPIDVMPFGWKTHLDAVEGLGGEAVLRTTGDGAPFVTDGGHYIIDCHFADGLADPQWVERTLRARPGVVETGLFLGMSPEVIVGRADTP